MTEQETDTLFPESSETTAPEIAAVHVTFWP
jgi:hypothetical protein